MELHRSPPFFADQGGTFEVVEAHGEAGADGHQIRASQAAKEPNATIIYPYLPIKIIKINGSKICVLNI